MASKLYNFFQRLSRDARFAYGSLFLLQLKVVWGMWLYRDLTFGDTASYFSMAVSWHHQFMAPVIWSPLYTGFYGSLLSLSPDAYFVTILHRLIIIFVSAILFLALMRRLLPHSIAWLIAAWWVILPVTFDTLYEVHLFSVIPTFIAYIIILYKPNMWTRGAALGVLLISAALSRNEIFIAVGLWGLSCFTWEIYWARKRGLQPILLYIRAYGTPLVLAMLVILFFQNRSSVQGEVLERGLSEKHTLNVCQIYAYNYQQRFSDWTKSPWTECQDLMMRDFGVPQPSMTEAIRLNPRAMLDYFLWNVRLIPEGVQVLLFNATSGYGQPDYIPRVTGSTYALVLSVLSIGVVVVGVLLLRQQPQWQLWIKERAWGWLALLCTVVVMGVVILMQRPRPSYLYNLALFLMAVIGMGATLIIDRLVGIKRFAFAVPIVSILLIVFVSPYFMPDYLNPGGNPGRPLLFHYQRLSPYDALLAGPNVRVLGTGWISNLCLYNGSSACTPVDYSAFAAQEPENASLADWLNEQNINIFYVDEGIIADASATEFLENSNNLGWDTLVSVDTETEHWRLLRRRSEDDQ